MVWLAVIVPVVSPNNGVSARRLAFATSGHACCLALLAPTLGPASDARFKVGRSAERSQTMTRSAEAALPLPWPDTRAAKASAASASRGSEPPSRLARRWSRSVSASSRLTNGRPTSG
jgi:hypothetical protein